MILRLVSGSFLVNGLPTIYAPAAPKAVWPGAYLRSSSILADSLKNTLRRTSSFFWWVSSYLTLL
jgi:hypothetical protein